MGMRRSYPGQLTCHTVEGRGYQVDVGEKRMTLQAEVHTKVQAGAPAETQTQVAQEES